MSFRTSLTVLLSLPVLLGQASSWEAGVRARGWAYCDVDGSFLFLEPSRQAFIHWDPGQGVRGTRPAPLVDPRDSPGGEGAEAEDPYSAAARLLYGEGRRPSRRDREGRRVFPERWILDARDHCWAAAGRTLVEVDPMGRILTRRELAAPLADMVRVADGFFVCYRTLNPFIQKFDWRGEPVWTYRRKGSALSDQPLHRIVPDGRGGILLAELGSLSFTPVGPGSREGQIYFTRDGSLAEPLSTGRGGRAPMVYCSTRNAVLAVFSESEARTELPSGKGLALACFRLDRGTVEWRSTGLTEGHLLIGASVSGAVFSAPSGGLATVPVP
ncbi:MAG: hypothetical protein HY823_06320 [Acidobacteria bacterium]|nr:hypothetical protein [Acidobacteriota bacterium]